jgi:hypothetical protein
MISQIAVLNTMRCLRSVAYIGRWKIHVGLNNFWKETEGKIAFGRPGLIWETWAF